MSFRKLLPRDQCQARLEDIFPKSAFDTVCSSPQAGAAVAALLYIDAVVPDTSDVPPNAAWARPTTCLWMSDAAYAQADDESRIEWRKAASVGRKRLDAVLGDKGIQLQPWYGDNSRETLRDETFKLWRGFGAMRDKPGLPTTSSAPRWALTDAFAALFDPELVGDELHMAIDAWRDSHLTTGDRLRISHARQRDMKEHSIRAMLPSGEVRVLEPGNASLILKGVVENWAPVRLVDPVVLTISEPGTKSHFADKQTLDDLGIRVNVSTLLPDALIADIGVDPVLFWVIEAVATDGPVTEARKSALEEWASDQRIPPENCRYLSAFISRNDAAAKKRLKDLALGTYAWYLDEPKAELSWAQIHSGS